MVKNLLGYFGEQKIIFHRQKRSHFTFAFFSITFIACSPILLLAYVTVLALEPAVIIRFGKIRSDRIGHFVLEAALAKSETQTQAPNELNFYYYDRPPCNSHWASIVEKSLKISEVSRLFCVLNTLLPGGKKHDCSTGEKIQSLACFSNQLGSPSRLLN